MASWARVVNTTTKDYMKQEEINILRNRKLTAILKERGRLVFNKSGEKMNWPVRYRRAQMQGYADMDTLTFPRINRWKKAEQEWRGYSMTDAVSKMERLQNRGAQQIIDLYAEITDNLKEDFEENYATEFYIDGNLTANAKRIHGFDSFTGTTGAVAGKRVAAPSDNFGNLSTALGAYGGTWGPTAGDWPNGVGDDQYDFWSPVLVDYTNTGWGYSTNTWPFTCMDALRFGIMQSQRNKSRKGTLDLAMFDRDMYDRMLKALEAKEQINTMRSQANSLLIKLGFDQLFNYMGVDVTWEYGIPFSYGYGFNCDMMEVRSMQPTLIVVDGPSYDIATKTWRYSLDHFGNVKWNPRHFCKWGPYTP